MPYQIPSDTFTQAEFVKHNHIKHDKTGWRILQRMVKAGDIEILNSIKPKIFITAKPRHHRINDRKTICPYIYRRGVYQMMGIDVVGDGAS